MRWIYDYFNFTTGEKYGFWVLIALIVIGITFPQFIEKQTKPTYQSNKAQYKKELKQFMKAGKKQSEAEELNSGQEAESSRDYFLFDPNHLDLKGLKKLGLKDKLANTIINYREAGGNFNKPSDLKAIYGMPDSTYRRLKPCVQISRKDDTDEQNGNYNQRPKAKHQVKSIQNAKSQQKDTEKSNPEITPVALNKADSSELQKVHGIGDFFAEEIVKRRDKLGGYHDFNQLLAIYNFDSNSLKRVKPQLTLNEANIERLSLNQDNFKTFLRHPYLSYAQVKAIFDYLDKVDTTAPPKVLKENKILSKEGYQKVRPYLKK